MADADSQKKPGAGGAAASGQTRHVGTVNNWFVLSVETDYCRVGDAVVGFDSYARIDNKSTASPNVKAQCGAKPLYRVGDIAIGMQANAGQGIRSQTSRGSGIVEFLTGQCNVKANGKPIVEDGSKCLVNCNAAGVGNARGVLHTAVKTVPRAPAPRGRLERIWDESSRATGEAWEGLKGTLETVSEAIGVTGDEAKGAAARTRIADGSANSARGLTNLIGPRDEDLQLAYLTGNPVSIANVEAKERAQQETANAMMDAAEKDWTETQKRSGTAGALARFLTIIGIGVVSEKGIGAAAKGLEKIAKVPKPAESPKTIPPRSPRTEDLLSPSTTAPPVQAVRPTALPETVRPPATLAGSRPSRIEASSERRTTNAVRTSTPPSSRTSSLVDNINQSSRSPRESAARLEQAIAEARSSGRSTDYIEELQQARNDQLERAREETENAKQDTQGKGVHVGPENLPAGGAIDPEHLSLVTSHPNAHAIERHGGNVTDAQLLNRAQTGVGPDGSVSIKNGQVRLPELATAFNSDQLLIESDQFVRNNQLLDAIANDPTKLVHTVKEADIGQIVGRGFERVGGGAYNPTIQGPSNFWGKLTKVQATYELNATTGKWETITIFPVK